MKFGFVSIYAWRPHVEHLVYLSRLLSKSGNKTSFLVCDGSVSTCYSQLLKGHNKRRECPVCIAGGFRTYPISNMHHINPRIKNNLDEGVLKNLARSSSYTIERTESPADCQTEEILNIQKALYEPIEIVYANALKWIKQENLDGVICFNGRMDLTRAVTFACEELQVPFITCERSWFGHGLQLIPNANCLSLKELDKLNLTYRNIPLTSTQAHYAAKLVSERFLQKNVLEWRLYNSNPIKTSWPRITEKEKVLILPSSKNEFEGHQDWLSEWDDFTKAIDDLLDRLGIGYEQCVLRCHPNWAEKIGRNTGYKSEKHYTEWAQRNGIFCIFSSEKRSTYDLISEADIVVLNGGSSAVEAAICGKKVICLGHSTYQESGFSIQIQKNEDWSKLRLLEHHDPKTVIGKTLRYLYLHACRFPQFVDYVRAVSPSKYIYFEGGNPDRIINMITTGQIEADDLTVSASVDEEDEVVKKLMERKWIELAEWFPEDKRLVPLKIEKRYGFRWIDKIRAKFPTGDR